VTCISFCTGASGWLANSLRQVLGLNSPVGISVISGGIKRSLRQLVDITMILGNDASRVLPGFYTLVEDA
jgi:hypothetical protein